MRYQFFNAEAQAMTTSPTMYLTWPPAVSVRGSTFSNEYVSAEQAVLTYEQD